MLKLRIFTRRDRWTQVAKQQSLSYFWGGRQEQEILAEMRQSNKLLPV